MACVTLKRLHEFDPLNNHGLMPKRARVHGVLHQSYQSASFNVTDQKPAIENRNVAFSHIQSNHPMEGIPQSRVRLTPKLRGHFSGAPQARPYSVPCQPTLPTHALPTYVPRSETSSPVVQHPGPSSTSACSPSLVHLNSDSPSSSLDRPLFSMVQLLNYCSRKVKEKEEALAVEYNRAMEAGLAEQHVAFLKFNHDQIYGGCDSNTSYLC